MDVFQLRRRLVGDYSDYIRSFIKIRDGRINAAVSKEIDEGLLWPDPLIQLNPSFAAGDSVDTLVQQGILHEECRRAFRLGKGEEPEGWPMRLHRHQSDAVRVAAGGHNYVLTTGTGSGKSLAYIIPIVNRVLQNGSGRRIQAVIVYPMNALANSQHGELKKFLCLGYPDGRGPVTFERYTGQENHEDRERIIAEPPDILLTNYVMLELLLTRPEERALINAAHGLEFLVLDELHTYRGRQGADVAMLVRRVRDRLAADAMQCVGTSATLASAGTYEDQQREIASVAGRLFGVSVEPGHVIGETLERATVELDFADDGVLHGLRCRLDDPGQGPPADFELFRTDPLTSWIETTFGVETDPLSGRLMRSTPRSITGENGAASDLHLLTGVKQTVCAHKIEETLLAGYNVLQPGTEFPVFAFRLHQFVSRGDTVYASPEREDHRHITLHGQQYVPNEDRRRALLPLAFCRECGQEYYVVHKTLDEEAQQERFAPRELMDCFQDATSEAGFLYTSATQPWPSSREEQLRRVPDEWCEETRGSMRIKSSYRKYLPRQVGVSPLGLVDPEGREFQYFGAPFRFCLRCSVAYSGRQRSDFPKLGTLGSGGRSTATTILSLAAILGMRDEDLRAEARKLLSFTDNRQDASLQAGHFNDFLEVGVLRGALYRAALAAGQDGLRHDQLAQRVFEVLNLPLELYATDPAVRFNALEDTRTSLRNVLGYRLYHDLRRGWRINAPNLEQCGLLEIRYLSLDELSAAEDIWEDCHPALATASVETRSSVAKVLLDFLRHQLAIKVDYLAPGFQDQIRQRSNQRLIPRAIALNSRCR